MPRPWFVRWLFDAAERIPIGGRLVRWFARVCDRLSLPWREEIALVEEHPGLMLGFALSTGALLAIPILNLAFRPIVIVGATHVLGAPRAGSVDAEPRADHAVIWSTMLRPCVQALLLVVGGLGCNRDVPSLELTREEPSRQTVGGVHFFELFHRDANSTSPLLVGLHGRGDTAEGFARAWHNFPVKLEIALARAPLPYGDGRQWFDWSPGMTDDALADAVSAAEAKLWPAIAELAHGRKVIIAGFSQGAVLAYVIAARHPDAVAVAFPIAGRMPDKLLPRGDVRTAPVYALHGSDDAIIGVDASRKAIAAFQAVGTTAELHEYAGVGHTITPAMRDDLINRVRAVIETL